MKNAKFTIGLIIIVAVAVAVFGHGCNYFSKEFGGTSTINLKPGQKLITAFPEKNDVWYLTRPMKSTDIAETYELSEKSNLGIIQGTFILKESK